MVTRVVCRLLVNSDARHAHVTRLIQDGDLFAGFSGEISADVEQSMLTNGPFVPFDPEITLKAMLILSDRHQLESIAAILAVRNPRFFQEAQSAKDRFVLGDRDDLLAEKLYFLTKAAFS